MKGAQTLCGIPRRLAQGAGTQCPNLKPTHFGQPKLTAEDERPDRCPNLMSTNFGQPNLKAEGQRPNLYMCSGRLAFGIAWVRKVKEKASGFLCQCLRSGRPGLGLAYRLDPSMAKADTLKTLKPTP